MKTLLCMAATLSLILCGPSAQAKVTKLEITSKQAYGAFRGGEYTRWDGRIIGELAPTDGAIPDLEKATRDANGNVQYAARISLFFPVDPAGGNGALLVDVPNRGNPLANVIYNTPRGIPLPIGSAEPGTGFLYDNGYAVTEVYWELGQGAELPSFTDSEGKKRFVEGVGFAIVRDATIFLAHANADAAGTPNPLSGKIKRVLGTGKSQDGRFLKTFLLSGFNTADGQRVFDGIHVLVSGAGLLPIMRSGVGPGSSGNGVPNFADPDFPGVNDGLLTIGEIVAKVEARGEVPPKMILINSTVDYLTIRASLGRTGATGTTDLPIPANVRMYDVAGAAHVNVVKIDGCNRAPGRLDWAPVVRATLQHLDRWVATNTAPPASSLMPLQPATDDPTVLRAPKNLPGAVIQVPQRDADGNALGGVRMPDIVVPLGVHGAQNDPLTPICSLVGAYLPFAATKDAAIGRQPSVRDRYKDQSDYVNRVRVAARGAEAAGFLLPEDAAVIINSAAETRIFEQAPVPSR